MAEVWVTCWVLAVVFLATLIRSAFGFGEALVAVPLLALLIPVEVATPLAVLFSITVAGVASIFSAVDAIANSRALAASVVLSCVRRLRRHEIRTVKGVSR